VWRNGKEANRAWEGEEGGGERSWTGERKGRIAEKADSVKRQILWQKTQMELIYVADAMEEENERQREREKGRSIVHFSP